jgi:prevent-host-death family protein
MRTGGLVIDLTDITSLTNFKRHTAEFIERLKQTGRPQVLTINGKAALVVQDAESYQRLLDLIERAEAIEGIRRGLASAARGEGRPVEEVSAELRSKYGLPPDG